MNGGVFGGVGSGRFSLHSFCGVCGVCWVCGWQFSVCVGSGEAVSV